MTESKFGQLITSKILFGDLIKFRCLKNQFGNLSKVMTTNLFYPT